MYKLFFYFSLALCCLRMPIILYVLHIRAVINMLLTSGNTLIGTVRSDYVNCEIQIQRSNLVHTMRFQNNLYHIHSRSTHIGKPNNFKFYKNKKLNGRNIIAIIDYGYQKYLINHVSGKTLATGQMIISGTNSSLADIQYALRGSGISYNRYAGKSYDRYRVGKIITYF